MRRREVLLGVSMGALGVTWRSGLSRAEEPAPAFGSELSFALVDSNGQLVRTEDFRGRWLLVFFGYTYCPDQCPTTLSEIAEALAQLGAVAVQVQPIFISIDPQRATPQMLREYVKPFDERILALTGTADQLERAAKAVGVGFFKVPGSGDKDYTFAHSAFVTLIGPEGGLVTRFSADEPSTGIASALK